MLKRKYTQYILATYVVPEENQVNQRIKWKTKLGQEKIKTPLCRDYMSTNMEGPRKLSAKFIPENQ
jgi:hypothetical protein